MTRSKREKVVTEAVALSCDTIGDLDGGVFRLLVNKEFEALCKDVDDRGEEDGKVRTLTIDVEIVKKEGLVIIVPSVKIKRPPRRANATSAKERMKSAGQTELLFQATNADNPDQGTFETETETEE
jgi:hypothetical protein